MKEIFNFISDKEKKALSFLCILLGLGIVFIVLFSLPQRSSYLRALSSRADIQKRYQEIEQKSVAKKREWQRWQEARSDIDELGTKYFYDEKDVTQKLRLDLEKIFQDVGVHVNKITYTYIDFKGLKIKKVNATFDLRGSYLSLKRFIHTVERFPKFLFLDRIDFLNIDTTRGALELRVVLAGYYAS